MTVVQELNMLVSIQ